MFGQYSVFVQKPLFVEATSHVKLFGVFEW